MMSLRPLTFTLVLFSILYATGGSLLSAAASSWNPTLLVNTESFQVIDEGDGTTDVQMQFGDTLAETLEYDRTGLQFQFSDNLLVDGTFSANESITVNADQAGSAVLNFGNGTSDQTIILTDAGQNFTFSTGAVLNGTLRANLLQGNNLSNCEVTETTAAGELRCASVNYLNETETNSRYVNASGDTMTGSLTLTNGAGVSAEGNIATNGALTVNNDNTGDATISFGGPVVETITFSSTADQFVFSDDVLLNGQLSVTGNISGSGTLKIENTIAQDGDTLAVNADNTAGNTIVAFGNQSGNQTLLYNDTTDRFDFSDDINITGSGTFSNNLTTTATLSGAALRGAGLTDCDQVNDKLQWDQTTGRFLCVRSTAQMNFFSDTTVDTAFDSDLIDYWDGTKPNITLSTTANEVLIMVSMVFDSNSNSDDNVIARIARSTNGLDPVCGVSTLIGGRLSSFTTDSSSFNTSTLVFVDAPASLNNVRYTVCSSSESESVNAVNIERIEFTLYEMNNAADLAEVYPSNDPGITPGMIVSIDPDLTYGIQKSIGLSDSSAIGIVSTKPAQVIGGKDGQGITGLPVALAGRVPVLVTNENGAIKPGDYVTTSSTAGYGMKSDGHGTVIGQALTGYNSELPGTVTVFVQKQTLYSAQSQVEIQQLQQSMRAIQNRLGQLERQ